MDRRELLKLNEEAVSLRETGRIEESLAKFATIKESLPALANSNDTEDKNTFVGLSRDQVITQRHLGHASTLQALNQALELYSWAKENGVQAPYLGYAVRGVSNSLMDLNRYEQAEPYLREMLNQLDPKDTAFFGDTQAHLSKCLLRQGRTVDAQSLIDKAIENIKKNEIGHTELKLAVWMSHALTVKALILNSAGDRSQAITILKEGLAIAQSQNTKTRIEQIQSLLESFGAN